MKPLLLIFFIVLTGCSQLSPDLMSSPRTKWKAVTSIELMQPLPLHVDFSRSFIQDGRAISARELRRRKPWCQFRLYEPAEALRSEREIKPGLFQVTRAFRENGHSQVSGLSVFIGIGVSTGSGIRYATEPDSTTLSNVMDLHSDAQPQVIEFKCSVLNKPEFYNYVTFDGMLETLGSIVKFNF